jgi:hypothetical protein
MSAIRLNAHPKWTSLVGQFESHDDALASLNQDPELRMFTKHNQIKVRTRAHMPISSYEMAVMHTTLYLSHLLHRMERHIGVQTAEPATRAPR